MLRRLAPPNPPLLPQYPSLNTPASLLRIQVRRMWPTRVTQAIQRTIQNRVITKVLAGATPKPPAAMKLLEWFPALRAIPAPVIGIGVRPEHVRTGEVVERT
jgi:hypothetical protein